VAGLSAPLAGSLLADRGSASPRSAKAGAAGPVTLDSDMQVAQEPLAISAGGTGATTASGAFDNLAAGLSGTASQQLVVLSSSGNPPGFVDAVVNVQAYGAKGNGTTDDTAAIQAALNAVPAGGVCYFPMPSSFYKTTAPLLIPNQVNIKGPMDTRPSKPRDAPTPTPPTVKAVGAGPSTAPGGYNMTTGFNAIITDHVYLATPTLASGTAFQNTTGATVTVIISGGTISNVETGTSPSSLTSVGTTDGTYSLPANDYIEVTYTGSPTWTWSAAASSGITVTGLVVDGSGVTGGSGHGIVLCSSASTVENCGIQNTPGNAIMFADSNWTGGEVGSSSTSMDENAVYKSTIYQPQGSGIVISSTYGKLTDGYIEENIVDFNNVSGSTNGTTSSVCIDAQNAGDWHIMNNHVYAAPADAFHVFNCTEVRLCFNQVDNYGQATTAQGGGSSATFYAFKITPSPYGACTVHGNAIVCNEGTSLGAAGSSNYVYYLVEGYASGQTNGVSFVGNTARQIAPGSGTSYAWQFNANGGTLGIWGFNDTTMTESAADGTISSVPYITGTGTVKFPDQTLKLRASLGSAGFPLGSTAPATMLTFTTPDDGQIHAVQIFATMRITTAYTGAEISLTYVDPFGSTSIVPAWIPAGSSSGTGAYRGGVSAVLANPNTAVTLIQETALTAGAGTFYGEIWCT
jgi:hypothetical protein